MSNHFSADNLKFPGDDARLDFTSDGLKPHDDLLAEFPFLGLPNP